LTVFFEDTDAYGIVYYANYLRFMERARSDMIRAAGVDQFTELARSGSAYAVVEVDIRYRRPGRLGDDLIVISTVDQVRASSVHIQQRVRRGTEVLTDARVVAAFLDGDGRPRRQPASWVEQFKRIGAQ
jgi:acyl-CoA thioester hydrolase